MSESSSQRVRFRCPRCTTRLAAPAVQVGTQRRCPRCQWIFDVPTAEETVQQKQQIDARGEYETSDTGVVDDCATYYAVVCSLCQTRMYALPEQVGTELTCPDCESKTTVSLPVDEPIEELSPEEEAKRQVEYAIFEGVDQPPTSEEVVYQTYSAVNCPLCGTRLLATLDQVGQPIECPDCGKSVEMPPPEESPTSVKMEVTPADEYTSGPAPETSDIDYTPYRREPKPERKLPRWFEESPSKFPPFGIFLSGVFTFPFYSGVWQRWLLLSILAAIDIGLIGLALGGLLMSSGIGSVPRIFLCLVLLGAAGILGVIWMSVASSVLLTVLEETAEGNETVEHWPGVIWIDWFLDSFYLINSIAVSVLPGLLLVRYANPGEMGWLIVVILPVLLFPIVIMSMLEAGTCLEPLSWPVVRSLLTVAKAWLVFYVLSFLLLAGIGSVFRLMLRTNVLTLFALFPLLIAVTIVYFRILGRFAWYGSQKNP